MLAVAIALATDRPSLAGWVLSGPFPMYAVGVAAFLCRPGNPAVRWLLATGTMFALETCLGDVVLPLIAGWPPVWILALVRQWAGTASVMAMMGFIGLFPVGRAERPFERFVIRALAALAVLVPVLNALSDHTLARGMYPSAYPVFLSPLFVEALAPLGPATVLLYQGFPLWIMLGFLLLAARYRRAPSDQRRKIRWLLFGNVAAAVLWIPQFLVVWLAGENSAAYLVIDAVSWPMTVIIVLGSTLVALFHEGVFGIDRPARRSLVYRLLWSLITVGYVGVATGLGILANWYLPAGVAVLLTICMTLLLQPVRGRLEQLADRWVFGARLDGYRLLSRFGAVLEKSPGPATLLQELAETVRRGLNLTWARVRLDPDIAHAGGAQGIGVGERADPALVVPITHGQKVLGSIECGPRRDGPLLKEDRRLLGYLAGQAAAVVHNIHLTAELSAQLLLIRRQAAELAASRERVAQGQDAERRRIQRDLHDGVQQEVVALTAKLGLVRQRLRRGDPRAEQDLTELHGDLGTLLNGLREFAYTIHPPVLSDRGLLEAVEAQAARLPVLMEVRADPVLRGTRFPSHIEATAWYAVAEALSNAVKHADATRVEVSLRQADHRLVLAVRDDGRGFDPEAARGLGLTGLADRLDIAGGTLQVHSASGAGTELCMEIPLTHPEAADA
ncbi:GAF domain-containing sensor histidine kinase [Planomonospora sp. ID67723]|uniref:sensor histidine kinase n=1 Tax=Planomonospora sp. ID67723 TaxID=2738134 RepID=UPI0018C36C3F|nr:GAF domain-containing sensor histidine kinase [Planomonospora sp. ID67723]MBG0829288.1 GAF domain-containing sensor histidine kinase [Planomonospora sp. ID67723]